VTGNQLAGNPGVAETFPSSKYHQTSRSPLVCFFLPISMTLYTPQIITQQIEQDCSKHYPFFFLTRGPKVQLSQIAVLGCSVKIKMGLNLLRNLQDVGVENYVPC
jgi:hypothetical protein